MADKTIDLHELSKHARGLAKIADDGIAQKAGVAYISFDDVHAGCHRILKMLADAGHSRSAGDISANPATGRKPAGGAPNPAAQDGMPQREPEAVAVGSIGL